MPSVKQANTWAKVDPDLCRHMVSLGHNELTHLPLDKMATILQTKFVPKGPIDKKSALVQVMAWRRTGDKPFLPELTLA